MTGRFAGWKSVAERLGAYAERQKALAAERGEEAARLNVGQRASLAAIASRITRNGVLIADEVGMGKTRIAVELARAVIESGGRVAILVPPGLGYQWHDELSDGAIDAPRIMRSLWAYLKAWENPSPEDQKPWFREDAVIVSHAFTNWRLGENADPWRWALVPEVYGRWRDRTTGQLPWGYHKSEMLTDPWVRNAGMSIVSTVSQDAGHPGRRYLGQLLREVEWPDALDPARYFRYGKLREWLERVVGLGLGPFDLVVTDEAHKARASDSGLSRLLQNVIVQSEEARRFALTATPVELDVSQWQSTLGRVGLDEAALGAIQETTNQYADAVQRLRIGWRGSQEAREAYRRAATRFQKALSPYLIRRDKREDPFVRRFHQLSGLPINGYREECEIVIDTMGLSPAWQQAVCAAEALSLVTRYADDPIAKRLRLTLGNGHGLAALLDQLKRDEELDRKQIEQDVGNQAGQEQHTVKQSATGDPKREQRAQWWLATITEAFAKGDDALYEHPAIRAAVAAIEGWTKRSEKVLVFGRFTRPLRALVDLLNAREMLRRIEDKQVWPQAKVHGERQAGAEDSEWPAVRAAHRQLQCAIDLAGIDKVLRTSYEREQQKRERLRGNLVKLLEQGLSERAVPHRIDAIFGAFKRAAEKRSGAASERHCLAVVTRAIVELSGQEGSARLSSADCARAFLELIEAVTDRDDLDNDNALEAQEASELWDVIENRLQEEYNRPQGGFARLMYGGTAPESRRMIQLAFNRQNSFPRVLVAQSLVGREGLNLHKACQIVVMLHPEWNPAVVEQQIGRVDRVGNRWASELAEALTEGKKGGELPRIKVCPVIFSGTYDEYNWRVLRERWDDLRAQLHGVVIPPRLAVGDEEGERVLKEIAEAVPDFSPDVSGRNL